MSNLDIIQINREPEAIGPSMGELIPTFKKIQEHNKAVFVHFTDIDFSLELLEEEMKTVISNLSNKGLCINICVSGVEDALSKKSIFEKFFKF